MIKNLTKHGNSYALIIDRSILDLLKIDVDTPLEITTDGDSLTIHPVRDKKHLKKLQASMSKTNQKYGKALRRLAK